MSWADRKDAGERSANPTPTCRRGGCSSLTVDGSDFCAGCEDEIARAREGVRSDGRFSAKHR